ncbi:M23 family metallopeptidase [Aquipuribacter hungaricus]|uniref:M23 family metallopeptidase n=2 Tax=Aquipuribacter hungaricus TaxID=545624 RepID=A0ABV7WDK7_9MICO
MPGSGRRLTVPTDGHGVGWASLLPDLRRRLRAAGGALLAAVVVLGAASEWAAAPAAPALLAAPAVMAPPVAPDPPPGTPPPGTPPAVDPAVSSEVLRAQVDALAAQVDELDVRVEVAREDWDVVSAELDALSVQEVQAQVSLDDAGRGLRADRAAATRRVRALYRTGGTVELAWTALATTGSGFADAASGFQTARAVLDSDAATVDRARGRVDVAVASSAQVQELRRLRAGLETEGELRQRDAEAALTARQDLLASAGEALAGAVERERQEAERVATRQALAEAARAEAARPAAGSAATVGAAQPQADTHSAPGWLSLPFEGARTSSQYGYRTHPVLGYRKLHTGTDFAAPCGTPITAGADGTVVSAGWGGGFGNLVVVAHGDVGGSSLSTAYAHQSRLAVSAGEQVSRGQLIGYVGTTGTSTGCHLHLEVRVSGTPVDPRRYL